MSMASVGFLVRIAGACAALALLATTASAQTYGYATLPPGTLNHTTASAIAKVMKEKGGVNVLVQPAAGGNVILPMVGRGEVEIGSGNIMEPQLYYERFPDLRLAVPDTSLHWGHGDGLVLRGLSELPVVPGQARRRAAM